MMTTPLIIELNDENYKKNTQNGYFLVDVWADWCGPCKQISPIVDQLSIDFQGKLSVGKLDATENSAILSELGIRNIPAILLYKDGEIVERSIGMSTKDKLTELIKATYDLDPEQNS